MMPTYRYRCINCRKEHDEFHGINEKKKVCQSCGGKLIKIYSSPPGIQFKGSGFYSTTYKGGN